MRTIEVLEQNQTQAQLTTAVAFSEPTRLHFTPNVYRISTNTTIPSTCSIDAEFGAWIYISSGVTLTVDCSVKSPSNNVLFKGAGTVAGTFGGELVEDDWFGATGGVVPAGQSRSKPSRSGYPEIDTLDAALTADGGDVVITGRELIGEMSFDTLAVTLGDSAGTLTLTAAKPGVSSLTFEILAPDTGTTLGVTVTGSAVVVQLTETTGDTAAEIATAINANGADTDGVLRATATGSGDTTTAVAETALAGGVGDYANTKVLVAGTSAPPANETAGAATWTDTSVTVTASGTPLTATEIATIAIQVDGVWSQQVSFLVGAGA